MIRRKTIVDPATGEIMHQVTEAVQFTLFDEEKGYLFRHKNYSVRCYYDNMPDGTTTEDMKNLYWLSQHIYKNTNMLAYRGNNNKAKPMTLEQMQMVIDYPDRKFNNWIKRMMRLGLIAKVTIKSKQDAEVQYYLNPAYFMSDKYLNYSLYALFQTWLDPLLPAWVIRKFHDTNSNN
jgi:hypothetical protein